MRQCIWTIFGLQPNKIKLIALPIFTTQQFPSLSDHQPSVVPIPSVINGQLTIRHFVLWLEKDIFPQRPDPLRLSGRAQLPGHRVQVQGGG